jgi:hypothetical protein
MYFFHPFCLLIKIIGKGLNYGPFSWKKDSTTTSHVFTLELLCKKDIYNINHYVNIEKNYEFFSCLALYCKCFKPSATFNVMIIDKLFYYWNNLGNMWELKDNTNI